MTTVFQASTGFTNIEGYRLNVTARLDPDNREHMTAIVEKTIKLWLYAAKLIAEGKREAPYKQTPEDAIKPNHFIPMAEPRSTVWADLPGGHGLTAHSHYSAQDALDIYWSRIDALATFVTASEPPNAPNGAQQPLTPNSAPNANLPPPGTNSGQPSAPVPGVINATYAPSPNKPQYAPGQMVAVPVNKVTIGTRKGSVTYDLWGPLGKGQYPLLTVFKTKPNSTDFSTDYTAAQGFLGGLGLSMDAGKLEALGNWRLICRAAHSNGKEYLNIQTVEVAA